MRLSAFAWLGGILLASVGACTPSETPPPDPAPAADETAATSVLGQAAAVPEAPTTTSFAPPFVVEPVKMPEPEPDLGPATPPLVPSLMRARPISGGTLRVLSDGRTAVASDSDRDQVYVVDLVTAKLTSTIALEGGDEPGRLIEDDAGRVHVALRRGGAVVTIDPARGVVLARRALCPAPRGLAFDANAKVLHVACAGGELVTIDAAPTTTVPLRMVRLDRDLRDVIVKGNRLLVSKFRSADVLVVGAEGNVTGHLQPPVDAFRMPSAVAWRMIDGPGDKTTVLHQRGEDTTVGTFPGGYGKGFGCGSIVTSTTSTIDADGSTITIAPTMQGALVAADVAISPDAAQMAVVSIGGADQNRQLQFFAINASGSSGSSVTPGPLPPGGPFGGPCQMPAGTPSFPPDDPGAATDDNGLPRPGTYLPPNGQVVAVAYDRRGNIIVQSREPASLQILTQRVDPVVLSNDSRFDVGHQLFHTATTNQIACVSCHPEGGEDGRVWSFQSIGQRRTQSLRGGIMNTAPFHWSGDEANLTSLMNDVFQGRMGGATLDQAQIGAVSAWLNQIPTLPTSQWADDATIRRGQGLFASAGCVACHAGKDFTNGQSVDVGTGGLFQVPQLHGLGFRAPYMHNGCASTLRSRFSTGCGGDSRHLAGSTLADAQIADLISYLDTL